MAVVHMGPQMSLYTEFMQFVHKGVAPDFIKRFLSVQEGGVFRPDMFKTIIKSLLKNKGGSNTSKSL